MQWKAAVNQSPAQLAHALRVQVDEFGCSSVEDSLSGAVLACFQVCPAPTLVPSQKSRHLLFMPRFVHAASITVNALGDPLVTERTLVP